MGILLSKIVEGNFSKSLIIFERYFILTFTMAYLEFLYLIGVDLALIPRER